MLLNVFGICKRNEKLVILFYFEKKSCLVSIKEMRSWSFYFILKINLVLDIKIVVSLFLVHVLVSLSFHIWMSIKISIN